MAAQLILIDTNNTLPQVDFRNYKNQESFVGMEIVVAYVYHPHF